MNRVRYCNQVIETNEPVFFNLTQASRHLNFSRHDTTCLIERLGRYQQESQLKDRVHSELRDAGYRPTPDRAVFDEADILCKKHTKWSASEILDKLSVHIS